MIITKTTTIIKGILCALIVSGVFLLCPKAHAVTINVADYGDGTCSLVNATSAYNTANIGDTIMFPMNGSCTWSSALTISKAVTIDGKGTTLTAGGALDYGFFNINGFTAGTLTRITGFVLDMNEAENTAHRGGIYVHRMIGGVTVGNIRIDHNIFHHGYVAIEYEHGKGLIDNNYFYNARKAVAFSSGSRSNADESWESLTPGTADALFIENNHFITDKNYTLTYTQEQVGTFNGGKLVVRHNEFDADNIPEIVTATYSPFMAHGNADGGCNSPGIGYWQADADDEKCIRRGQSVIEFYNNTLHGRRIDFLYKTRGSVNFIHNNSLTGTVQYAPLIYFWEEEYGTNFLTRRLTWPSEDQVHNSFVWNNRYNGSARWNDPEHFVVNPSNYGCTGLKIPIACCTGSEAGTCGDRYGVNNPFIQMDREFFLHAPCGASDATDAHGNICTHGKAIFTVANGASNSYPTDGNTYSTKGTMVFTATGDNAYIEYTPYTYPHPLRANDDTKAPAAPAGLTVK